MPLRDHFRPPLDEVTSWEGFHGQWPAVIVQQLRTLLPAGFVAEPRVHSGAQVEVDVAAFEYDQEVPLRGTTQPGQATTALWAPPEPSLAVETTLFDDDEYEVRIYDARRGRRLVAAIELVSPANKDRPEHRSVFVAKCAALIRKGIAVSIVDIVSIRRFNLYVELLGLIGQADPTIEDPPPPLYAASCRWGRRDRRLILEAWSCAMAVGQPLPTLPLWLSAEYVVPLDLERSYEQTCTDLWIA